MEPNIEQEVGWGHSEGAKESSPGRMPVVADTATRDGVDTDRKMAHTACWSGNNFELRIWK